jgi:sarcosine oxidase delta subunit
VATAAVTTAAAQTPVATQPPTPAAEPTPTKAQEKRAKNTKARQEKRAANKMAGDKRENERRRERRAEHQEQWKSDPTCKEFIKLFAHTTGARVTANLQLVEQFARRSRVASEASDRTSSKTSTNRRTRWQ